MNLGFFFFIKKKIERYKTILIFEMLLKIDLFFVILYGSITAPLVFYDFMTSYDQYSTGFKVIVFVCLSILILVFFFQALAYKSVKMILILYIISHVLLNWYSISLIIYCIFLIDKKRMESRNDRFYYILDICFIRFLFFDLWFWNTHDSTWNIFLGNIM